MARQSPFGGRRRRAISALLGLAVAAGMRLGASAAAGEEASDIHDHTTHGSEVQAQLASLRAATARFHRVEEAVAAGYELGWVNLSGVRIVAGCVSNPTACAMGYHYFNAELMADNDVTATEPEVLVYVPAPDQLAWAGAPSGEAGSTRSRSISASGRPC